MHQLQPVGTRVLQQHCGCVPVITFHSAHAPTKGKHCQFILLKKVSMLSGTHACFVWAGAWWFNPVIIKIQLTGSRIPLLWKPVLILPVKKKIVLQVEAAFFVNLLKLILIWMQGGRCGELSSSCFISNFNCSTSPAFDLQSDVPSCGPGIILTTTAHSYLIIFKHPDPFIDYKSHEWG